MRALLGDHAVFYHEYPVSLEYGRQPVRYNDAGAPHHHLLERVLYRVLGDGVERRGSLVEYEDLRILQYHPRERQPLLLAARELEPAVAHLRHVAVRLAGDEIMYVRDSAGLFDLLHRGVTLRVL